ncbi:hypothetical protein GCM10023085_07960 [Actinomadura viridis]|uniref:Spore coat protein U domain-containing protein n=1 Tax=Actinomadura viridis TaxID=58110 RepID=A0A931GQJ6_9ACTN|nr:hypothetical protein [Actinomadura viridis]MBG6091806.1 hypothetical protein [Actinomadura viridis]
MRPASFLVGLSAIAAAAAFTAAPAHAEAPGLVDGSITAAGTTCTWTNATTSNTPPNTLTIDRTTISLSCSGSVSVSIGANPTVSFNDANGTATATSIVVTATVFGVQCGYTVNNASATRQGTTRTYTGGPYTATKTSGGFLCPSSETINSARFVFH